MTKLKKKKKATPPQEKEALTEESQKAKEGEKEVLAPPQVSVPFPQRLKYKSEDGKFARFV